MDLLQNPFHILTATLRDNRLRIVELEEDRQLFPDANECTQARSNLTHPRKRLSAEMAWLLGVNPKRAGEVLELLESPVDNLIGEDKLTQVRAAFEGVLKTGNPIAMDKPMPITLARFLFDHFKNLLGIDKLMPIAQANLLAAGLSRLPDYSSDDVAEWIVAQWILEISRVFEDIDPEEVRTTINEERIVSGFPEVADLSVIKEEIRERRHYCRQVITSALNKLSVKERAGAVTTVAEATTDNREKHDLTLIGDLVDSYEVGVQEFLKKEDENIKALGEKLRAEADAESPDSTLAPMVNQLIQVVKNWETVAHPIQVIKKSKGLSHEASYLIAVHVRELAVNLFKEYDKLDFSRQLINMLQEVFTEHDELTERIAEDVKTLDEIAEERKHLIEIEALVEKLQAAADAESPDSTLAPMVNQLIQVVKNCDTNAHQIQVIEKSKRLSHGASYLIAGRVRELAVNLFNEHGQLDFSRQLINMLQEVFTEDDELAERIAEDARALDEIAEERVRLIEAAKERAEEWRREITYEADIGTFLKSKLRISPDGIEWKGDRWALDSITRIGWGGTRHSVNGIPTGTTYSIIFGNGSGDAFIELKDETIYNNFIDRLWRAVGVRLLTEYLEGLRDGKKYRFGSAVISDHGVELEHKRLFSSNERVFCRWSELVIWNDAGDFCIGKKEGKKLTASFSYQYEDNIHVLEAAIRMFREQGGDRLSNLLDE